MNFGLSIEGIPSFGGPPERILFGSTMYFKPSFVCFIPWLFIVSIISEFSVLISGGFMNMNARRAINNIVVIDIRIVFFIFIYWFVLKYEGVNFEYDK